MPRSGHQHAPGLVWDWPGAVLGVVYAFPAALTIPSDVSLGLALAVGVVPAAIVGIAPTRRGRTAILLLGVLTGVPMFLGSVLAGVPWLAVPSILLLAVGATLLAARNRIGRVALVLSLPMVGVGLSYDSVGKGLALAAVMIVGSLYAFVVSLLWPEEEVTSSAEPDEQSPPPPSLSYGIQLGLTGASAAAIGFALGLDHVGWATAASLLVMRPSNQMQETRSVGRVLSVFIGAMAGGALTLLAPPPAWLSLAAIAVVAGAAATRRSYWYVTSAFTTFLAFLLLLHGSSAPHATASRFLERIGETVLGVGLAFLFGIVLPWLWERFGRRPEDAG